VHVVATAGHVDHGKSTLIEALTGQQPDRLAEEHRRGLSIELGYCWTGLPLSGDVAFVDVPGHERFISTMLAGVGPVPVVLFVVAADDPWMPQADEHLAILDALEVNTGVLAVTRSDLGDAEAALRKARAAMAATTLADIPAVIVSGVTGEGLSELRTTLDRVLASAPPPDPAADVRLWVDRMFTRPGAGTVVTGTLPAGRIRTGDTLACDSDLIHVRGLQSMTKDIDQATGVARVSLRLGSGVPTGLRRGTALTTPGAWYTSDLLDVSVTGPGTPPAEPVLHVGSASVSARVRPLATTRDGWLVRVRVARPLPWHVGDVALLRDPGRRLVWRCRVLDPAPPGLERRGDGRRRADALAAASGTPDLDEELRRRGMAATGLLRRLGVPRDQLSSATDGRSAASGWLLDPARLSELSQRLVAAVAAQTAHDPLEDGLTPAAAARLLELPDPGLALTVVRPPLAYVDGRIRRQSTALPGALEAALSQLEGQFRLHPFQAPDADRLKELGLDRRSLAAAERAGRVLRVGETVVLLPGADQQAVECLRTLPQPFTTSAARQKLDTSRRVVLPLLAHLDRAGLTRRLADDRRTVI
jgi:selenocysteine-specific elongation factor